MGGPIGGPGGTGGLSLRTTGGGYQRQSSTSNGLQTIQLPSRNSQYSTSGTTSSRPDVLLPSATGSSKTTTNNTTTTTSQRPTLSAPSHTGISTGTSNGTSNGTSWTRPNFGNTLPNGQNNNGQNNYGQNYNRQTTQYGSPYSTRSASTTSCTTNSNGLVGLFDRTIGTALKTLFGVAVTNGCAVGNSTSSNTSSSSTYGSTTYGTTLPSSSASQSGSQTNGLSGNISTPRSFQ